jgi:hypothetical protein
LWARTADLAPQTPGRCREPVARSPFELVDSQ